MDITTDTPNVTETLSASVLPSALTCTAGVTGNILALIVLFRSSTEQKKTVFYRLVGVLAVTDLLGILFTAPVVFLVYANGLNWVGGQPLCNYSSFAMIFYGYATVFIIGVMGMERYLALMHPFVYSEKITTSKVTQTLVGLYVAAFVLGLLPLMGLGKNVTHYPGTWCFFEFDSRLIEDSIYAYIYSCIGIFMIFLLTVTNVAVIAALAKMKKSTSLPHFTCQRRTPEKETQMIIFLAGITFIFITCWSPLMVLVLIKQAGYMEVDQTLDLTVIRFASFNQILDPWVYILFRKSLFVKCYVFLKKSICAVNEDISSHASGTTTTANDTYTTAVNTIQATELYAYSNGSYADVPNGDLPISILSDSPIHLHDKLPNGNSKSESNGSVVSIRNGLYSNRDNVTGETRF